jgi:iron complex transport system ATP-binding protein
MSNVISLDNVNAGYKEKIVLKNIDLKIEDGDFVSLIGPNGSGKTTLLRCITGVIPVTSGKLKIFEKNIDTYKEKELAKKISLVNQIQKIEFPFRVKQLLLMGKYPYLKFLEDFNFSEDISKILEEVDLKNIQDNYIFEISAGEFQLVMLGLALVQDTPIIALDEPTSHLDLYHQKKIMDILKNRNKQMGKTVLFVSHSINLASIYSDRIIVLKDGMIYKIGTPEEIITKQLIKQVYNYEPKLVSIPDYKFPLIY